jgi:hypothetical protein
VHNEQQNNERRNQQHHTSYPRRTQNLGYCGSAQLAIDRSQHPLQRTPSFLVSHNEVHNEQQNNERRNQQHHTHEEQTCYRSKPTPSSTNSEFLGSSCRQCIMSGRAITRSSRSIIFLANKHRHLNYLLDVPTQCLPRLAWYQLSLYGLLNAC